MGELAAWAGSLGFLGGTVIALASFLGGTFFRAWIEKSVQARFDRELEELRSQIHRYDRRVEVLRESALAAMASRSDALNGRRIRAIETLWMAAVDLGRYRFVVEMLSHMDMEKALRLAERQDETGQNMRRFAEAVWGLTGLDNATQIPKPDSERPFLTPLAWAIFSAYRSAISIPLLDLTALRMGTGRELMKEPTQVLNLASATLPHRKELIESKGVAALYFLIDELEEKLLETLSQNLNDPAEDAQNVDQAAEIIRLADKVADADRIAEAQRAVEAIPEISDLPREDGPRNDIGGSA